MANLVATSNDLSLNYSLPDRYERLIFANMDVLGDCTITMINLYVISRIGTAAATIRLVFHYNRNPASLHGQNVGT